MDTKLILLLVLLLINPVSAKFICGEVESLDSQTPAWYTVTTYLASNEFYSSTCQVSPSNNRYCCELDKDKMKYQWQAGDIFKTKITDPISGYFATPKNLTLTGEGYDIAPILTLEKAITITNPKTTLTISKTPQQIQFNIPSNCINITKSQANLTFGKNNITIKATCNSEEFKIEETFYQIQDINFQKEFPEKIRNKKSTTIKLKGTLSHSVENIKIQEYVPTSWEIQNVSNNATIEESTPEYNIITWQVNNNTFDFNYKVKATEVGFWPEYFTFKTTIDNHVLKENQIQVYKFIPLPIIPKKNKGGWVYNPKFYSKVSEIFPLIYQEKNFIAALYSNGSLEQESLNLQNFLYEGKIDRKYVYLKSYQVQTTLNQSSKGKMIMEYKANKTFLDQNDYKEIVFFERQDAEFLKITGAIIESSDNEIQYRFESEKSPSEIFIFAEKNSLTFLDKILNLWDKIKFW